MKEIVVTPEQKLQELGLSLPNPRKASGNYVGCVRTGNLIFTAGQGTDEYRGKLGKDVTIEVGYQAARQCILNLLAARDNISTLFIASNFFFKAKIPRWIRFQRGIFIYILFF